MKTINRTQLLLLSTVLIALALLWGPSTMADTAEEPVWLVSGGTVLAMDEAGTIIEDGAVAIRGSRILEIDTAKELQDRYPEARRLDAAGRIVMPGLVNTHTHVPMTLFRGLADDLDVMGFLYDHIFPAEAKHVDEDFVRVGTRLGCLEFLRGGITTFVDMYYYEDAVAEEAARCGIRAVLGETLIDFPAPDHKTWDAAMAYTEAFLKRWHNHALVTPAVAPHAVYTVSGPHLQAAHKLAKTYDAPILIHLAETPAEIEQVKAEHGMGSVAYLSSLGILDDSIVAAHMILPDDGEMRLLAKAGVGVAHCPESNMKVAAGVAPVPELLAAGIAVGLGTDGAASNNDLSLWDEMDSAAKLHKVTRMDPKVMPAKTLLEMATRLGAQAVGMGDEIGSLEPGKLADLILVRVDGIHQIPSYHPYSALVYSTKASDVDTVIVHGKLVMTGGRVLTLDESALRQDVERYRQDLVGKSSPEH